MNGAVVGTPQIIHEFEKEREARIARYRRDKTNDRRYQEMMRGQKIVVVPRWKEADHPAAGEEAWLQ